MAAFLHCKICGAFAVDGILSRYSWGHVDSNPHGTLQVCPECLERYSSDWQEKAVEAATSGNAEAEKPQTGWY